MKFGIALSGGGIRGIAHAGVLKALEDNGIKADVIGGCSSRELDCFFICYAVFPLIISIFFLRNIQKK